MTDPSKANDRIDRMIAAIEQHRRGYPPERSAAEQAENDALVAKYPGQVVAYRDEWDGKRLTRHVLAASRSGAEVRERVRSRPDYEAIRRELNIREIEDPANPDDDFGRPWFRISIDSAEPLPEQEAGDGGPRLPG